MTPRENIAVRWASDPWGVVMRVALAVGAFAAVLQATGCVRHCDVPLTLEVYTPPRQPPAGVAPVTLKCRDTIIATAPELRRE